MKVVLLACIALLLLAVTSNAQTTVCTKYSTALNYNNSALVSLLVSATFANITAAASPLLHFFDGTTVNFPGGMSIDFRQPSTAQSTLVLHLVQFFGMALGCMDGSIAMYAGASMPNSHSFMNISNSQFTYFKSALLGVGAGAGVVTADLATVNTALETTRAGVCNQPDCQTICNRYSGALGLTNNQLVTTVVLGTFMNVSGPASPITHFFDGSFVNYPGGLAVDFRNATDPRQATLVLHLVQFFGMALGCTDGTIATYAGLSLPNSHSFMNIHNADFAYFNSVVVGVMAGAGVSAADQTAVAGVLEGTRAQICNQADCTAASGSVSATTKAAASVFAPIMALLLALLAFSL